VKLTFKGRPVLVMADGKPDFSDADTVSFSVRDDRMVLLEGNTVKDSGF
jgi:hypothetical protein